MTVRLLFPPLAFVIVLLCVMLAFRLTAIFRCPTTKNPPGRGKAYACGEDSYSTAVRPDYTEFFPFAYFFTIMHVVAMMLATIPGKSWDIALLASLYIVGAIICMSVLFRR